MNTAVIRLAKSNIVIAICIKSFYSKKECLDLFNEESTERSSETVSNLLLGRRRYVRSLALFAFLAAFFGSIIRPMSTKANTKMPTYNVMVPQVSTALDDQDCD